MGHSPYFYTLESVANMISVFSWFRASRGEWGSYVEIYEEEMDNAVGNVYLEFSVRIKPGTFYIPGIVRNPIEGLPPLCFSFQSLLIPKLEMSFLDLFIPGARVHFMHPWGRDLILDIPYTESTVEIDGTPVTVYERATEFLPNHMQAGTIWLLPAPDGYNRIIWATRKPSNDSVKIGFFVTCLGLPFMMG